MGQLLEDMVSRHKLYITAELPSTFKRPNNTGKSTVDLTFGRGSKNVKVK